MAAVHVCAYVCMCASTFERGPVDLCMLRQAKQFAVKVITKAQLSPRDLSCLKDEVTILSQTRHPCVNQLIEIFETDKKLYIVLECLRGPSLFDRVVGLGSLDEGQARAIMTQMVPAIRYLHQKGIYHRDLKPENLMFFDDTATHICIIDFGLSKQVSALTGPASIMRTSCGSPEYAAPEILMGLPYTGGPVDCWSIGVLLFTMLAGYNPFYDEVARQINSNVIACAFDFNQVRSVYARTDRNPHSNC
jgi:serine/threonine protein kinase